MQEMEGNSPFITGKKGPYSNHNGYHEIGPIIINDLFHLSKIQLLVLRLFTDKL